LSGFSAGPFIMKFYKNARYLHQDVRQMFVKPDFAAGFIQIHFY